MKLAIDGGEPAVTGPIPLYNSLRGRDAGDAIAMAMNFPLSGFIAGHPRGGYWVQRLEDKWAETFGVKHAIALNSATSGLLAAAAAVGLGPGADFIVSPFTMSATAAAPRLTGASPIFCDVEPDTFSLDTSQAVHLFNTKAVFLTHLFGLAVNEAWWKGWCDRNDDKLIVDAAQAPFARCDDVLAGTIADIGVYSLNVHKHFQCGEGGVCVTNDGDLADRMRAFLNHAETYGGDHVGLNLRMTEVTAAIALSQLRSGEQLVAERIERAEMLLDAIGDDLPGITPPHRPPRCRHVFYTIPFLIDRDRDQFVNALRAEGVPMVKGYIAPLTRLPAFRPWATPCPVADELHDRTLFYWENCRFDPTPQQILQIAQAFEKVANAYQRSPDRA